MTDSATCDKLVQRGGWAEDAALHRCTPPIGPRNTFSNAAYVLVGFVVAAFGTGFQALEVGCALAFLGVCSAYYHSEKTLVSNRWDWAGMYAVFASLVVHGVAPVAWAAVLAAVIAAGTAAYFAFELADFGLDGQIGVLLSVALLPAFIYGRTVLACIAFGLLVLAYVVQRLDHAHSKLTGIWGHAIWHCVSAAALGLVFFAQPMSR